MRRIEMSRSFLTSKRPSPTPKNGGASGPDVAPSRDRRKLAVTRSLITLKALTYAPTGAIVAAPTTSLPELIGGVRNWDYRFCWVRDATLSLHALIIAGYLEEARDWREWIMRAVAGKPSELNIVYGLRGERRLTELELSWLPGYENSAPVRTGNAAYNQLQLDVYGEIIDTLYLCRQAGIQSEPKTCLPELDALSSTTWKPHGKSLTREFGKFAALVDTLRIQK